jgi:hypothetical protein
MSLTNLKTVQPMTATVTSTKLVMAADRAGLGFGAARAYPTDNLSPGLFPTPQNPEPEQLRSRQVGSVAVQMRKQMRVGVPDAVPPAGPAGLPTPGSSAVVSWRITAPSTARSRDPKACARISDRCDCQSHVRVGDKRALHRGAIPAATVGK